MLKHVGIRVRTLITMVLVTMMMAGGLLPSGQVAAQAQSVQSQLTGVSITYGPPYVLQPDIGFSDELVEMIAFLGAADILAIGFMSSAIDLNGARDIILEGLFGDEVTSANIDRGDYTGVSYSLDMMNLDGSEMGVFTLFMNQRSHGFAEFYIFIAPPSLFGGTVQTAQNSVAINGTPVMDGVDATVMGNMIIANVGITGGTAVTDVTDVPNQTNTTETTQTTTTQPTQSTQATGLDPDARATYLAAVSAEFENANTELTNFANAFDALGKQTITAEEARPIVNAAMQYLAGANDRAAAIQPPAGMETFHQEYLAWARAMTDVGVAWANFGNGTATADDHRLALIDAIEIHGTFVVSLDAEMNATTQPTEQPTQTTQTTQPDGNARATYLAAVKAEFDTATAELTTILTTMDALSNEQLTAQETRPIVDASYLVLAGTSDRAAAIQPPAGMESFHQEFLDWAQAMTDMGASWANAMTSGDTSAYGGQFENALLAHTSFGDLLEAELSSAVATEETTTTTGTTRTTRSTTATETAQATEASGTTTTSTDGRDAYLQAVRAEYDVVTEQVEIILETLEGLANSTIAGDVAIEQLTEANSELVASATRMESIEAPAGMEDFHARFLEWQAAVTDTGDTWALFASQQVEAADYTATLDTLIGSTADFGLMLTSEESSSGSTTTAQSDETAVATESAGTTRTTRTTRTTTASETPDATETTGNTSSTRTTRSTSATGGNTSETSNTASASTVDRDEYLQAVRAEYDIVSDQLALILEALDGIRNSTMSSDDAIVQITAANEELTSSAERMEAMQPPAGLEDFHAEFMDFQASVVDTGEAWNQFLGGEAEAADYTASLSNLIAEREDFGVTLTQEENGFGPGKPAQAAEDRLIAVVNNPSLASRPLVA